jgi:ATP-dependent DNA ligase
MDLSIPVVDDKGISKSSSRRSGIMLCYPFEEKRLSKWKPPYIIQPKLDGVRCRAIISGDGVVLISSENHIIDLVPHINAALGEMFKGMCIELDGELYKHGMTFQEIISITSRSKNIHADYEKIEYHIFDIISQGNQLNRTARLLGLGEISVPSIEFVQPNLVRDIDEVMRQYQEYIGDGYEGFVIRDAEGMYWRKRFTGIMKFKPHQKDTYKIIGTEEEYSIGGEPKGTLGAFICSSSEGTVFKVGTGLTQEQRINLWKDREGLRGKLLKVKYQALTTGKGVPRFPVALEVLD